MAGEKCIYQDHMVEKISYGRKASICQDHMVEIKDHMVEKQTCSENFHFSILMLAIEHTIKTSDYNTLATQESRIRFNHNIIVNNYWSFLVGYCLILDSLYE